MKKFNTILVLLTLTLFVFVKPSEAQIWEPEGLNMPGAWNGWANPPTNNLALASYTQTPGGEVVRRVTGVDAQWHTLLHCSAAGDVLPGNHNWIFTSGSLGNIWGNKWAGINVSMNSLQSYTYNAGADNNVTLADGIWYTVNYEDLGYMDTRAIFMETSAEPVDILTVSEPTNVMPNTAVGIDITSNSILSPEEMVYICYTTDNWTTSNAALAVMTGTTGSATIPGQAANTGVDYYAFTSTMSGITADFGLQAIDVNNNAGANYSYSIGTPPPPTVGWANLQWPPSGNTDVGQSYNVYGQIYITGVTDAGGQGADVQAWVGYSTDDTDPATWINWVPATYNGDAGNNDEYMADLGVAAGMAGTYYYATRYQYLNQAYVYGGYQGGFWDGTTNVSGVLTISSVIPLSNWSFLFIGLFAFAFVLFKFRK